MIPIIGAKKNKILNSFVTIFFTSFFVIPILYNFLYFILSCSISVNRFKYTRINVAKKNKILKNVDIKNSNPPSILLALYSFILETGSNNSLSEYGDNCPKGYSSIFGVKIGRAHV